MVNFGIIGAGGKMGKAFSANVPSSFNLLAVCDTDPERLTSFPPSIARYDSCEAMLKRHTLDLVAVATHNRSHFKNTVLALESGSSVLVEKPVSSDLEEALQLKQIKLRHGQRIAVDYEVRFSKGARTAKRFIERYGLMPLETEMIWVKKRDNKPHDGVIIQDLTHALDLTAHYLFRADNVYCKDATIGIRAGKEVFADTSLYLSRWHKVHAIASYISEHYERSLKIKCKDRVGKIYFIELKFDISVDGTSSTDSICIYDSEGNSYLGQQSPTGHSPIIVKTKKLERQLCAVGDWIATGRQTPEICTLDQAVRNLQICYAAKGYRSQPKPL
ncbi:MAG TPA: Gfo/Idh/MocA family oxidoreductase [Candidatus Nanoarchaeia archaeon]|nr:Gfo/Idh/MocA family oxidoreductase [Candidatus Nanoarchaeia archaeon]